MVCPCFFRILLESRKGGEKPKARNRCLGTCVPPVAHQTLSIVIEAQWPRKASMDQIVRRSGSSLTKLCISYRKTRAFYENLGAIYVNLHRDKSTMSLEIASRGYSDQSRVYVRGMPVGIETSRRFTEMPLLRE